MAELPLAATVLPPDLSAYSTAARARRTPGKVKSGRTANRRSRRRAPRGAQGAKSGGENAGHARLSLALSAAAAPVTANRVHAQRPGRVRQAGVLRVPPASAPNCGDGMRSDSGHWEAQGIRVGLVCAGGENGGRFLCAYMPPVANRNRPAGLQAGFHLYCETSRSEASAESP